MIVVTDTSVVLNLCWLRQERLLPAIYSRVFAPNQVRLEFERKVHTDSRFAGLVFPSFIAMADPQIIPVPLSDNLELDPGETAALALALERKISRVLIDERAARFVAIALGLSVSGLLGVLIEGKRRKLVPLLRPLLDALVAEAKFWISPTLRKRVLITVGE